MKVTSDFELTNLTLKDGKTVGQITFTIPDYPVMPPPVVEPPPIVTPPSGGISSGFEEAIRTAAAGKTVLFNKGDYTLAPVDIPVGVSVDLGGSTIRPNGTGDRGLFQMKSATKTAGNQSIKNGTVEANQFYSALIVENRDNVESSISVRNTRFNGVWFNNVQNGKITKSIFHNAGWSGTGYLSGAINIRNVTDFIIEENTFTSDGPAEGTGIEALWKYPDNPNVLRNVKILRNTFKLDKRNPWNNGQSKNFSIELHNTDYRGIEIAYNNFGNEISLAGHRSGDGVNKTLIHDNYGDMTGNDYFLELVGDDFEVYNNKVSGIGMFAVNFQKNGLWRRHNIYNNELTNAAPTPSWGALILVGGDGIADSKLGPNKFPTGRTLVKYMGTNQSGITLIGTNQV